MISHLSLANPSPSFPNFSQFAHLQTLDLYDMNIDLADSVCYGSITSLTLDLCRISVSRPLSDNLPNLQTLRLRESEVTGDPVPQFNNLLATSTLRRLMLVKIKQLDMASIGLPIHLTMLTCDSHISKYPTTLTALPHLVTLHVLPSFAERKSLTRPSTSPAFNFSGCLSMQDVTLDIRPSRLVLPPTSRLTLRNFEIKRSKDWGFLSTLICVVLEGLTGKNNCMDQLMTALASVSDLSILGHSSCDPQIFSTIPMSVTRFSLHYYHLQKPEAILQASRLTSLTIANCQVDGKVFSKFNVEKLRNLKVLTVKHTPGLHGLKVPTNMQYHHDHDKSMQIA